MSVIINIIIFPTCVFTLTSTCTFSHFHCDPELLICLSLVLEEPLAFLTEYSASVPLRINKQNRHHYSWFALSILLSFYFHEVLQHLNTFM